MYLHGLRALMGGVAAVFIVSGLNKSAQFAGIGISIVVALVAGYISGKVLSVLGRRTQPYEDSEEFLE